MQTEKPSFYKRLSSYLHEKMKCKQTKKNNNPSKTELVGEMDYMDHSNALEEIYFPFSNIYVFFLLCSNTVSYIFYQNIFPTQNNKGIFIGLAAMWSLKIGLLHFLSLHLPKNVIQHSLKVSIESMIQT